ncbi:MAG: alpha/beta fold hydrolase, partial [Anaerolineae bacterium]
LGEVLMAVVGRRLLVSGLVRHARLGEEVPAPLVEDLARQYLDQMQYQGFSRALLSTVRHGLLRGMNETYARVGKQGHPVLLIWGEEDRMVPFSLSADAQRTLPQAEFHAIQGAGHAPHLERPELINTLIAGFLTQA